MKRKILNTLLVLFIAAGWWSYKLIWGKPLNFDHLMERYLVQFALTQPELLTMVGIIDNTALDFHSGKLSDASPEKSIENLEKTKRFYRIMHRYDRDRLKHQQAITFDMMDWFVGKAIEGEPWMFHDFPVNQVSGVQGNLPSFMDTFHQVKNEKSAGNYVSRLKAFETKFEQVSLSVLYRAERGVIPPRFIFDHVLKEMKGFIEPEPAENALYTSFAEKLDTLQTISDEKKSELLKQAEAAIRDHVYPGYNTLISAMESLYDQAGDESGAWTLPDGDAYYRYMVRNHTTLDMNPEEIHEIGLNEVERIKNEMFTLFNRIGIPSGTVADRFNKLDERPGTFYPETEESYTQIIEDYTNMIEILYERTAPLFKRLPKAPIEVRPVPELTEATAPFAYYSIPALDGSRPGIFFINLRSLDEIPKYGMLTLTAHEAVPGHHFQLALQQEIEGVPTVRRLLPFTAYAEGWALYTEWVTAESGLYDDDPESDLGRLQGEMFRAVRLVVDTGIHHYRWPLQKAIDFMVENTGMPQGDIKSEIERYVVWPGQALAYKIGMIHIQNLRKEAETRLGEKFDVAEFHDVVLMNGSLPLRVLTDVVENYIEQTLES